MKNIQDSMINDDLKEKDCSLEIACTNSVVIRDKKEDIKVESEINVRKIHYPMNYVKPVDKITTQVFCGDDKLLLPLGEEYRNGLYDCYLDKKKSVRVKVALDYKELIDEGYIRDLPHMDGRHYSVMDSIISHICAGQRQMTITMIYRVMTGKIRKKITVKEEDRKLIREALTLFRGIIEIQYSAIDREGNEVHFSCKEPLLTYTEVNAYFNGQWVENAISIPEDRTFDPPLLRWAMFNRKEIDTREVTLQDVPGLNNTGERMIIKSYLYTRVIHMRNSFERKTNKKEDLPKNMRTIRYEAVYRELEKYYRSEVEKSQSRKKQLASADANWRRGVKHVIELCLKHWAKSGLIAGYEHKRDKKLEGSPYVRVELRFI